MEIKDFYDITSIKHIDIDKVTETELDSLYTTLDDRMNIIYKFVLSYNEYINSGHNYPGNVSENLSMMDIHILTDIVDHANMTVSSLARLWHRSASATSQTVRKLLKKELVYRENSKESAKVFFLHATDLGKACVKAHKQYDVIDTVKTIKTLNHEFSYEEIEIFFNILKRYTHIIGKNKKAKADSE